MPTYSNYFEIQVPIGGAVVTLPSDDNYDLYVLTSNTGSAINVTGVIDIQPSGTLIDGLTYEFVYDGKLLGTNTFTVFGEVIPNNLRNLPLSIKCTYFGSTWTVIFNSYNNAEVGLNLPVKVFKAKVEQFLSAAPVVTSFKDDYGLISTSRVASGSYELHFPLNSFDVNNTLIFIGTTVNAKFVNASILDSETIAIDTQDVGANFTDNLLNDYISIETYNIL